MGSYLPANLPEFKMSRHIELNKVYQGLKMENCINFVSNNMKETTKSKNFVKHNANNISNEEKCKPKLTIENSSISEKDKTLLLE